MTTTQRRIDALRSRTARDSVHFEIKEIHIPSDWSRYEVQRALTDAAEYGRWELLRTRLYFGGEQRVWLRRKSMRVSSTL